MGLEVATFISGLNANNPVGATDPKSQGDDHLRLIKSTLLNSFPNITGAMNASHSELNNLVGVTGKTGTGDIVLSNSPTFTGSINGSLFTSLNASNISSGILADARLSTNVPFLNAPNDFLMRLRLLSTSPRLDLFETDAPLNQKIWILQSAGSSCSLRAFTDDLSGNNPAININRSGITPTLIAFNANSITANGFEVLTANSNLSASKITGILPASNGGTGQTSELGYTRRVTLNWTIQADPGGTPVGTAGDVFAYF